MSRKKAVEMLYASLNSCSVMVTRLLIFTGVWTARSLRDDSVDMSRHVRAVWQNSLPDKIRLAFGRTGEVLLSSSLEPPLLAVVRRLGKAAQTAGGKSTASAGPWVEWS